MTFLLSSVKVLRKEGRKWERQVGALITYVEMRAEFKVSPHEARGTVCCLTGDGRRHNIHPHETFCSKWWIGPTPDIVAGDMEPAAGKHPNYVFSLCRLTPGGHTTTSTVLFFVLLVLRGHMEVRLWIGL